MMVVFVVCELIEVDVFGVYVCDEFGFFEVYSVNFL